MNAVALRDRIAINLHWRTLVPARFAWASRRQGRLVPGVTVCTVNYNGVEFLPHLVSAVRRFSPVGTRLLVVDNASADGSVRWLRDNHVPHIRCHANLRHELGMQIAVLSARTEHVVILDVDAFPISEQWLPAVIEPLRKGAKLAGVRTYREFVHPSYLALRTADFIASRASFRPGRDSDGTWLEPAERMARTLQPAHYIEVQGPGPAGGQVYGDGLVFHNWMSTRYGFHNVDELHNVTREQSRASYAAAVDAYLTDHGALGSNASTSSPRTDST